MKITKADVVTVRVNAKGVPVEELHIRCECQGDGGSDTVYGLDAGFTSQRAVREFIALHKAIHAKPPEARSLTSVVGRKVD